MNLKKKIYSINIYRMTNLYEYIRDNTEEEDKASLELTSDVNNEMITIVVSESEEQPKRPRGRPKKEKILSEPSEPVEKKKRRKKIKPVKEKPLIERRGRPKGRTPKKPAENPVGRPRIYPVGEEPKYPIDPDYFKKYYQNILKPKLYGNKNFVVDSISINV